MASLPFNLLRKFTHLRIGAVTSITKITFLVDPSRFRFTHQTSFVRRHVGLSSKIGIRWIVSIFLCPPIYTLVICKYNNNDNNNSILLIFQVALFRQFFGSVTKVDYLTMRHGFINVLTYYAPFCCSSLFLL